MLHSRSLKVCLVSRCSARARTARSSRSVSAPARGAARAGTARRSTRDERGRFVDLHLEACSVACFVWLSRVRRRQSFLTPACYGTSAAASGPRPYTRPQQSPATTHHRNRTASRSSRLRRDAVANHRVLRPPHGPFPCVTPRALRSRAGGAGAWGDGHTLTAGRFRAPSRSACARAAVTRGGECQHSTRGIRHRQPWVRGERQALLKVNRGASTLAGKETRVQHGRATPARRPISFREVPR
jgi:hypothetical protein